MGRVTTNPPWKRLQIGTKRDLFAEHTVQLLERSGIAFRTIPHSTEVNMDCPFCGKPGKLYVNVASRIPDRSGQTRTGPVAFCQYEQVGITWRRLARHFHLPLLNHRAPTLSVRELREQFNEVLNGHRSRTEGQAFAEDVQLPFGTLPAWKHPAAVRYLGSRGITAIQARDYQIGFCPYGQYANRVVFPITRAGKLVGFQTRSIINEEPKYLSSSSFPRNAVLYPEDHLEYQRLILTEGVVPALTLRGLATFGKHLAGPQLQLITKSQAKEVVLAWDRDAWSSKVDGQLAPARRIWRTLSQYLPVAGLILPANAPQPDQVNPSVLSWILERVCRKGSSIWIMSPDWKAKRIR